MKADLIAALIRSQGYAVVPDLVPRALAKDLRDRVLELQAEDERTYGKEYLYAIGQEGFVVNVGNRGEAFEHLLNSRPFDDLLEQLLGPDAHLYLYQGVIGAAGRRQGRLSLEVALRPVPRQPGGRGCQLHSRHQRSALCR